MAPEMENVQPLPWRAEWHAGLYWCVRDANDFQVFIGVTREEAEFIVRAVNSHHALVDDLHAAALHIWHEMESPDAVERGLVRTGEIFLSGYEHGKRMAQAEATDHVESVPA